MQNKAAAARTALFVEKLQRTEKGELDEEAILDDRDQPQIDFAGECEHLEGELYSDKEATSVMDTDPPASMSQRTPELNDRTKFTEVHKANRSRSTSARQNTSGSRQSFQE